MDTVTAIAEWIRAGKSTLDFGDARDLVSVKACEPLADAILTKFGGVASGARHVFVGVNPASPEGRLSERLYAILGGMGAESVEDAARRVVKERDAHRASPFSRLSRLLPALRLAVDRAPISGPRRDYLAGWIDALERKPDRVAALERSLPKPEDT